MRAFDARLAAASPDDRARAWVDLIVVSVLLDAGAGDAWRYREPGTGIVLERSEGLAVRVYTIAYGNDADNDTLERIATASGGKEFTGDPKGIEAVYVSISSFF